MNKSREKEGSQSAELLLSIIIVNWNTCDAVRDCISSLFKHTEDINFELIVVDNASADNSVEMLGRQFPQVRVIANDSNLGFAKACNQGMRASRGRLLLLLNSDTYVCDDVIARMAHYVLTRPEISMASCQLQYPDGRIQHCAYRSLSIWRSLFEDLWLYKFVPDSRRDEILLGGYWDYSKETEADWLAGAFLMLRREVFEQTNGFSEDFFMYGEDSEWCMRVRRAGHRLFYTPVGVVYHVGSVSSDLEWTQKERLRLCHIGGLRAYSKTNGRLLGFLYNLARLLGSATRFAAHSLLALPNSSPYHRDQQRFYGWQAEFFLQALKRRSIRLFSQPAPQK